METKEEGEGPEEQPPSPYQVLRQISEEAVRVAGEALQNVCTSSSNLPPSVPRHRRSQSERISSQSEALARAPNRNNSFQLWKTHMQRALQWGNKPQEQRRCSSFNPEVLANQKRQWYKLHSKTLDHKKYKEPDLLLEHFIVLGLHPYANLEIVEDEFARRKKRELEMEEYEMIDLELLHHCGPSFPTLEPQILFKYPPRKRLAVRPKDLAAFCFPEGVKAHVLERTPSLNDLNELVYGQDHLCRDDSSFIFSLKVGNNAILYGVCLHIQEIVQRPPAILGASSPIFQSSGGISRFMVAAPRCYCVLTKVPFFELHFGMLNSIIAQDRLNRITRLVCEMSLTDYVPSLSKSPQPMNENIDSPHRDHCTDWMASAIPVDSAVALTAAAAGIILDDEVHLSSSKRESVSPVSVSTDEASDHSQTKEIDKDGRKNLHYSNDYACKASENGSDGSDRMCGNYHNGHTPPEVGTCVLCRSQTTVCLGSYESLFSPVRSMGLEDEDDEILLTCEKEAGDEIIMECARENKNDLLQIVCRYHALPLPSRGSEIIFQPLEHLQAIVYRRPLVSALGLSERYLDQKLQHPSEASEVNLKLAAAEEALALSTWTTSTICRVLSLENVLSFVVGVLLEKQVVVVYPNLGVLSAIVLALIPMIRPFEWQSFFLPVLPGKMFDFLDAPVPFIVGVQHKPADWKMNTFNLVHVDAVKDEVTSCSLPALPRCKEIISELRPMYSKLSCENSIAKRHPVYKCNEVQDEAAAQFLTVMGHYLESLCSDLMSHTITSVQSNNDRVSLLLKDSFIDSFPSKDQPFIKLFVDTQMFTVLSDSRLSRYENEH